MQKIFLAAFFCLSSFLPALAADAVLQRVKGKVLVKTGGAEAPYEARSGDPLYFGDRVRTEKGALAHLAFNDGAVLLVKENADFALEGRKDDTRVSFNLGEFLIGLKRKLAPGNKFQVKTPAAVAAVRGTLFWGLSDAAQDTTYACFASAIHIEAGGQSLLLNAGQTVRIPYGKPPEAPKATDVPLSYLNTFAVEDSLQGLDKLVEEGKKP